MKLVRYYRCKYTQNLRPESEMITKGSIVPRVDYKFKIENSPTAKKMYSQSVALFHMAEKNCNTCKLLERVIHEKSRDGFLQGRCTQERTPLYEYVDSTRKIMKFHPEDPMSMSCYIARDSLIKASELCESYANLSPLTAA